jgi:RNA-directed DNA polymerase
MSKLINNLTWNEVRWTQVRKRVSRIQHRIFKAKRQDKNKLVTFLQIRLINSLDAKLLSVLQVTTLNKGRNTAGVDRQVV